MTAILPYAATQHQDSWANQHAERVLAAIAVVMQDSPHAGGDGDSGEHHEHQHDVAGRHVFGGDAERDHRRGGLTATTLASEPVLLGCLPDHPLARRGVVSVSELADKPFVDYTPGWGTRTIADQLSPRQASNGRSASKCRTRRFT